MNFCCTLNIVSRVEYFLSNVLVKLVVRHVAAPAIQAPQIHPTNIDNIQISLGSYFASVFGTFVQITSRVSTSSTELFPLIGNIGRHLVVALSENGVRMARL
jgi:hypothetical protein